MVTDILFLNLIIYQKALKVNTKYKIFFYDVNIILNRKE